MSRTKIVDATDVTPHEAQLAADAAFNAVQRANAEMFKIMNTTVDEPAATRLLFGQGGQHGSRTRGLLGANSADLAPSNTSSFGPKEGINSTGAFLTTAKKIGEDMLTNGAGLGEE